MEIFFENYFLGMQQDFKLALLPPILAALFRLIFLYVYAPEKNLAYIKKNFAKLKTCFNYGFFWGMDFHAYVYLVSLVLFTLPTSFQLISQNFANNLRTYFLLVYCVAMYCAFLGKMIFYAHFHDIFNRAIFLGKNADKKNLLDIFFNQNHGAILLVSLVPFACLVVLLGKFFLALPSISYPQFTGAVQIIFNIAFFIFSIVLFYWFRYGGTFNHSEKPEWDEIPPHLKQDIFLSKATVDDFVALEMAWKSSARTTILKHTEEETRTILKNYFPEKNLDEGKFFFERKTNGPLISRPKKIFFLLAESHAQAPFDDIYKNLNLMQASQAFYKKFSENILTMQNFLPAGQISVPSVVGLLSGLYDSDLELNETSVFQQNFSPTSMAVQLKKLGYQSNFFYGGKLSWASLFSFLPAVGFEKMHGWEICPENSPRTWLGVYDHIFLNSVYEKILRDDDKPDNFYFIYTTSLHSPYTIPLKDFGFDIDKLMPNLDPNIRYAIRKDKLIYRRLGTTWYADTALMNFAEKILQEFPDSLVIITGDHAVPLLPFDKNILPRTSSTLRDDLLTSFMMYHKDFHALPKKFSPQDIGCHMNILPTILELIAPKNFSYSSIMPSLFEKQDHITTPFAYMTPTELGLYQHNVAEPLQASADFVETKILDTMPFAKEQQALKEISVYYFNHPEKLLHRE